MLMILWIVGALVAIIVLAMLLVPMFIDEQALLELAKEQVQTQTGGELVVEGDTELSFFPRFGLRLEGTSLSLPAQTEYHPDVEASITELDVGLSLLPLLGGNVNVGTIVIAGATADIPEPQAPPVPSHVDTSGMRNCAMGLTNPDILWCDVDYSYATGIARPAPVHPVRQCVALICSGPAIVAGKHRLGAPSPLPGELSAR